MSQRGASNDAKSIPKSARTVTMNTETNTTTAATNDQDMVQQWQVVDVLSWAQNVEHCSQNVLNCLRSEQIDGEVLLALSEEDVRDFRYRLHYKLSFAELKKLWLSVQALQRKQFQQMDPLQSHTFLAANCKHRSDCNDNHHIMHDNNIDRTRRISLVPEAIPLTGGLYGYSIIADSMLPSATSRDSVNITVPVSLDGRATNIPPEFFKTAISLGYSFVVTWITSFVMVIVHERVPDMKRYPPLPDIFLDNVPHIPWAFHMCEITGTLLFLIWICVCIFHKYRMVLLRRFFALAGTVFLLRCCTMLITSLSVPGTHLQCNRHDYAVDDVELTAMQALELRISRAYIIWTGLGMSIQGVRTCGDYMFSGHTVTLTLLNFFITEYTPRNLYFLHTLSWLLNMFGIFFILAGHEHYSIDVFVAFYITSRLFLYYHTLANNQALMSGDSNRTRVWFPMFSYFESSVNGIIPNEYVTLGDLLKDVSVCIMHLKDSVMLTTRRFWIQTPHLAMTSKNVLFVPNVAANAMKRNVGTSTTASANNTPTPQTSNTSLTLSEQSLVQERTTSTKVVTENLNKLSSAAGLLHLEPQLTVDNLHADLLEHVPRDSNNKGSKKEL